MPKADSMLKRENDPMLQGQNWLMPTRPAPSFGPSVVHFPCIPQSAPTYLPQTFWRTDGGYLLTSESLGLPVPINSGIPFEQSTWSPTSNSSSSKSSGTSYEDSSPLKISSKRSVLTTSADARPTDSAPPRVAHDVVTPNSKIPPPSHRVVRHGGDSDEASQVLPGTPRPLIHLAPTRLVTKHAAGPSTRCRVEQTAIPGENLNHLDEPTAPAHSNEDPRIQEQQKIRGPASTSSSTCSTPEKSVSGRLSNRAAEALTEGFAELDTIIHKLRELTGLSPKQILKRWQPANPREVNDWNIYQKYFRANVTKELSRLPAEQRPSEVPAEASLETIRGAYTAFREAEPNSSTILRLFWRMHEIDESNTTFNGRCHEFNKYVSSLRRLSESASTVLGFETVFCVVGGVIQQDQSLSSVFCSKMVPNFFADRLRLSDSEMEGHLKAHVYDYTSRKLILDSVAAAPSARQADTKEEYRKLLGHLKQKIRTLVDPCKILELKKPESLFSDIPYILAQNGWVLENWPEVVPFPCDLGKGKGIAKLEKCYREPLLKAFNDPLFPLKAAKKFTNAVPVSEPVIIGVPPDPESKYERGRRRFFDDNQTEDRNGPCRQVRPPERGVGINTQDQIPSKRAKKRLTASESDILTKDSENQRVKKRKVA